MANIANLSFEEKTKLLTGTANMETYGIEAKNVPARTFADGPHGIRASVEDNCTHFPSLCSLACTWSEETAYSMGQALARDCIKHNINMLLGPGVNIKRHILCGRNFEYFSEDPVLSGEMAAGYINGLQSLGVKACIKHFALNNQECERSTISVEVDERTMREIYLKPFQIAIEKANPASVMCAFNKVNGIWCSENKYLLNDILKNEWNYDGMVVSDWGAVQNTCRAFSAGLDLQMPKNSHITEDLAAGIEKGVIDNETIDNAVSRMLNFIEGDFNKDINYDRKAQHKVAKNIAADGMVLLKNKNNVLPITANKYKKVAVVGEYAVSPLIAGQGSAMVYQSPDYVDSPFEELKKRLPEVDFKYIEVYKKRELPSDMMWPKTNAFRKNISDCDLVVFFAGSMESQDTEYFDRQTAYLNPNVELFIKSAKALNKPIVLVLQNGGALILENTVKYTDAVLETWLSGEASGSAVADILCGNINPSGKLSETFPNRMRADLEYPGDGQKVEYKERFDVGYRYYDKHTDEILYPFGYGLSYTEFEYSNLELIQNEDIVNISFDLKNIGDVDGAEVVQLYVGDMVSTVVKPIKELKKFKKVKLKAQETKRVEFTLTASDYAYYNVMLRKYVAENGKYDIYIGASSQDIRLKSSFMLNDEASPYSINCISESMIG